MADAVPANRQTLKPVGTPEEPRQHAAISCSCIIRHALGKACPKSEAETSLWITSAHAAERTSAIGLSKPKGGFRAWRTAYRRLTRAQPLSKRCSRVGDPQPWRRQRLRTEDGPCPQIGRHELA